MAHPPGRCQSRRRSRCIFNRFGRHGGTPAAQISKEIEIPTIGIGASAECDGQILVLEDMLGLNPNPPKFVKQYGNLLQGIEDAVEGYAKDVKSRAFPTKDQTYQIKK